MNKFPLRKYHNWLIFNIVNSQLQTVFQKYAKGKLADIGCGEKPYKEMLAGYISSHIGIDHAETQHRTNSIDIFSSVYDIPVPDAEFDTVLCTYVLEHIEEPNLALKEANRILKPRGYAIYTVPLFWHLHEEPRDFYRYTKYGLKYLFEKNNFEVIEIISLSGFIIMVSQEFCYYLNRFRSKNRLNPLYWFVPICVTIIQATAFLLRNIDRSTEFTIEYLVVARKINKN